MDFIIWSIVIFVLIFFLIPFLVFFFIALNKKKKQKIETLPTFNELYSSVNNINDYKKILQEYNFLENKITKLNHTYIDNFTQKKYDLYEKLLEKLDNKIFFYQYYPEIELSFDLTKEQINHIYKLYSYDEYQLIMKKIKSKKNDWIEINGSDFIYNEYETKPEYFDIFLDFINISNNTLLSTEQKILELNNLAKENVDFKNDLFFGYADDEIGKAHLINNLYNLGIPLAEKLFEMGYTDMEKISELKNDQILNIKGFGKIKTELLLKSIKKYKS